MGKKLIEVALSLEAINKESAREKSIRHGHPSTLHPWWARRPLAACRAVLFAQLVDDPSSHPEQFPWQERVSGCPYVFHRNGKPPGDIRKSWYKARRLAGLDGKLLHDLRRTTGTKSGARWCAR
jgi:adenine-specific DNA methylase